MKKRLQRLLAAGVFSIALPVLAEGDLMDYILWFQVNDDAVITTTAADETTTTAGIMDYTSNDGKAVNAARIFATDGTSTAYLNLGYLSFDEGSGNMMFTYSPGVSGYENTKQIALAGPIYDDEGDLAGWGTGAALGSILTGEAADLAQTVAYTEFRFAVELGYIDTSTYEWTTLAVSDERTYQDVSQYISSISNGIVALTVAPWTPINYTAVPEPSTGLLLLFGAVLFGLHRPREGVRHRRV